MPQKSDTPIRLRALGGFVVVIAIGLFARSHRAGADQSTVPGFLATYTGDVVWAVMFALIGRFLWPRMARRPLIVGTAIMTLAIEFLQLWQVPWMVWLRAQPIIGFLLGNAFVWSDVACLIVGCVIAWGVDCAVVSSPNHLSRSNAPP